MHSSTYPLIFCAVGLNMVVAVPWRSVYHSPVFSRLLSTLDKGQLLPLTSILSPQMGHETLFDELKASPYRCKRPSKYTKMCILPGICLRPHCGAHDASRPPSRLGKRHSSPYPTHLALWFSRSQRLPLGDFGASIFWGVIPQIFSLELWLVFKTYNVGESPEL